MTFWYWAMVSRGSAGAEGAKGALGVVTTTEVPPVPLLPATAAGAPGLPPLLPGAPASEPVQPAKAARPEQNRAQNEPKRAGRSETNMLNSLALPRSRPTPFRADNKSSEATNAVRGVQQLALVA